MKFILENLERLKEMDFFFFCCLIEIGYWVGKGY